MIPHTSSHDVAPAATKRTLSSHRLAPQPWWCLCRGRRGGTEGGGCWWQGVGLPWLGKVAEAFSVTNLPGWDRGCEGQGLPTISLPAAVPCSWRAETKGARRKISSSTPLRSVAQGRRVPASVNLLMRLTGNFRAFCLAQMASPSQPRCRCASSAVGPLRALPGVICFQSNFNMVFLPSDVALWGIGLMGLSKPSRAPGAGCAVPLAVSSRSASLAGYR